MGTPEEDAKMRAEVMAEIEAEEAGTAAPVDAGAASAAAAAPENAPDPFEGLNPALKQVFTEMSSRVETLKATETRLKQAESRIGAISNEFHAAKKELATAKAKPAPTAEQMAAAAESDEQWASLAKDFPEWAAAFDGRFDKKLNVKLQELKEQLKAEVKPGVSEDLDKRLLSIAKPKWKQTVASPEWKEWLAMQPQESRDLIYSDKAEDAVTLITAFEDSRQQRTEPTATEIAAARKQRLKTAEIPVGGKANPPKSEADMTVAELRANIGKEIYAET